MIAPLPSPPVPVLTPAEVRVLLDEHGLRPSRALGQNFLTDANTARKVVRLAGVEAGDQVLEIGPGLGSLTLALLDAGAQVTALELDRHVLPALTSVVGDHAGVVIEHADARTYEYGARLGPGPWSCVSNLPYNVATPVVMRILDEAPQVRRLLVMVQREVGERLAARVDTRAYGAVSVKVAYYAEAEVVGVVPPTVFFPRPKVESALVRIDRRPEPTVDVPSPDALFAIVRAGFATRRKMLRRALRPMLGSRTEDVLTAAGVAPTARAESLDLDAWAALARESVR
jgi:16S rRNA (adenine1518-N6/adenine1519-N6)-dimethyltransferase